MKLTKYEYVKLELLKALLTNDNHIKSEHMMKFVTDLADKFFVDSKPTEVDKDALREYWTNTKVQILNPGHSKSLQKLLFSLGARWLSGTRNVQCTKFKYMFISKEFHIFVSNERSAFDEFLGERRVYGLAEYEYERVKNEVNR